jgi:DNA gyrase inhibitor GyrI
MGVDLPFDVAIVDLPAMRVASAYGFGECPEEQAWNAMQAWAQPKGLLDDLQERHLFGFNNPYPTPASPKYGYEMWLEVGPALEPGDGIRILEFFGGRYAVQRCEVHGHPETAIPAGWQSLAEWCRSHDHQLALHPALERFLSLPSETATLVLQLYCPIRT